MTGRGTGPAYLAMLVGATFLMGSSFVAGKILLNAGVPALLLVGYRFFVAALATLPVVMLVEPRGLRALVPAGFGKGNWLRVGLIGLLQTSGAMGLLFMAMEHVSASTAAILLFTNPILVALLGRLFLGEALRGLRVLGLVLGLAGAALAIGVSGDGAGDEAVIGALIGLCAALSWATSTIVNKSAAVPMAVWPLSFWQILTGSLALILIAWGRGEAWPPGTTPVQWLWFLWLAVPGSTLSFGLWFMALARGGATRSSGYLFLAPLFATLISAVVLDAGLSWAQGLGGILVCAGLWLVNREIPARDEAARLREAVSEGNP